MQSLEEEKNSYFLSLPCAICCQDISFTAMKHAAPSLRCATPELGCSNVTHQNQNQNQTVTARRKTPLSGKSYLP